MEFNTSSTPKDFKSMVAQMTKELEQVKLKKKEFEAHQLLTNQAKDASDDLLRLSSKIEALR